MEQFKRKQVVMLQTNVTNGQSISNIYLNKKTNKLNLGFIKEYFNFNQHLYITSDDKMKEGDFYYCLQSNKICKSNKQDIIVFKRTPEVLVAFKKIIATTDTSLNLPQPSQQFIEEYIEEYNKDNVITNVLVKYEHFDELGNYIDNNYHFKGDIWKLKIKAKDNTITIKKVKDNWCREEIIKLFHQFGSEATSKQISFNHIPSEFIADKLEIDKWIEKNL